MGKSYDPVRLGAPDGLVAEVDGVTGRRYKATGGGMYEMHPRDAAAFRAEGAFVPSIGGPTIRGGYACPGCGFCAVVRTCSRCGERCETDAERRARLVELAASQNTPEVTFPPIGDAVFMALDVLDSADAEHQARRFFADFEAGAPYPPGSIVMEYEINTSTGAVRETGPACEMPATYVPAGASMQTPTPPTCAPQHIDPRYARAALAADAARRTIYRDGRA